MNPRNTSTGAVLEQMVKPALERGGYSYKQQVDIGERPSGGRHIVDLLAKDKNTRQKFLVSLKWQQVSGTAEQKVVFDVVCLAHAVVQGEYNKAYVVLGGEGWSLRDFFISGGLNQHLRYAHLVDIVSLESFVAIANQGRL